MTKEKTRSVLYLSQAILNNDVKILTNQKQNLSGQQQSAANDSHAHPLVALTASGEIVNYNKMLNIPESWASEDEQTGEATLNIPESQFSDSFIIENGLYLDYKKFSEHCAKAELTEEEKDFEHTIARANMLKEIAQIVTITDKVTVLRNKNGKLTTEGSRHTGEVPDSISIGFVPKPENSSPPSGPA